ncbi:MAG: GNAT family N-acetyltransferase [Phycisphaerae bacterium]|nr:GNAT family N-acetyltransferase [Phycisphaerae bacterium]
MRSMDNNPIEIRPATASDYDGIAVLWLVAGLPVKPHGRDGRASFVEQLRRFPTCYLVACDRDRVVGVVLGTHDQRKGWINRLAVDPGFRRRGIAARLITACEEALRAEGIEIIAALIEEDNESSIHTFECSGYRNDVPARYFRKRFREDI